MNNPKIQYNISLKPYNTFGLDVKASKLISICDKKQLVSVMPNEQQFFVLGGGSNLLFTENIAQTVIKIETKGIKCIHEDSDSVLVQAEAGEEWDEFVAYTLDKSWYGLENLSGIPGCVGASPVQNIGAFGAEAKDNVVSVEVFDVEQGIFQLIDAKDCGFGYRESNFKTIWKDKYILTSVVYRLSKLPAINTSYKALQQELESKNILNPSPYDIRESVIRVRNSKLPDPKILANAGSFFKNPIVDIDLFNKVQKEFPNIAYYNVDDNHKKLAAAWLIEHAGLKGIRHKEAGVHDKQALVIVNHQNASPQMIVELSNLIIDEVWKKFGVKLEPEVQFVKSIK